jgi:hypothetical protein
LGLKYKLVTGTSIFGGDRHHSISYANAERTHQFLTRTLSARSVPDPISQGTHQAQHVLKGLRSVHALVPDAYAQCTHKFLTRILSARISS